MTPLKKVRKDRGDTIYDVAEKVGCAPATISRIERGDSTSPDLAAKISEYFDKQVTEEQILYPERFKQQEQQVAA